MTRVVKFLIKTSTHVQPNKLKQNKNLANELFALQSVSNLFKGWLKV